jgi:hypothetical protein
MSARQEIIRHLPHLPLGDTALHMQRYEVAIAYNVDPPYRHSQDYLWLQVAAQDKESANLTARQWVLKTSADIESTGMVRVATPHVKSIQGRQELSVLWNIPLSDDWPDYFPIRDPVTDVRIGYLAPKNISDLWIPGDQCDIFALIIRRPYSKGLPVGVGPLVTIIGHH